MSTGDESKSKVILARSKRVLVGRGVAHGPLSYVLPLLWFQKNNRCLRDSLTPSVITSRCDCQLPSCLANMWPSTAWQR